MTLTWSRHAPQLREVGAICLQTELLTERLQRRIAHATAAGALALPVSLDELDLICERLDMMRKRVLDLRDRVTKEPRRLEVNA